TTEVAPGRRPRPWLVGPTTTPQQETLAPRFCVPMPGQSGPAGPGPHRLSGLPVSQPLDELQHQHHGQTPW
ncbi:hypothetical protein, partial [Streptomyces celluloflavus]